MTAPRWTAEELRLIADIAYDANVELAQQKLVERFGGPQGQTTDRLLEAAQAADTLRAGGQLDLGNGEVFMRDSDGPSGQVLRAGPR
jgi:hypothetical protein